MSEVIVLDDSCNGEFIDLTGDDSHDSFASSLPDLGDDSSIAEIRTIVDLTSPEPNVTNDIRIENRPNRHANPSVSVSVSVSDQSSRRSSSQALASSSRRRQSSRISSTSRALIELSPSQPNSTQPIRFSKQAKKKAPSSTHSKNTSKEDEVLLIENTHKTNPPGSSHGNSSNTPKRASISCPVCLDHEHKIKETGRQLNSTICGHIFCNECIVTTIKALRRCPTCRKKLTLKSIHPIFV